MFESRDDCEPIHVAVHGRDRTSTALVTSVIGRGPADVEDL